MMQAEQNNNDNDSLRSDSSASWNVSEPAKDALANDPALATQLQSFGLTLEKDSGRQLRKPVEQDFALQTLEQDPGAILGRQRPHRSGQGRKTMWALAAGIVLALIGAAAIFSITNRDKNNIADDSSDIVSTDTKEKPNGSREKLVELSGAASSLVAVNGELMTPIDYEDNIEELFDGSASDAYEIAAVEEIVENDYLAPFGDTAELLKRGELKVFTQYRPDMQDAASRAALNQVPAESKYAATVVTVDTNTGAVLAVVSGNSVAEVTIAHKDSRQPGSAFKPFVLASLFEQNYLPFDELDSSSPCEFETPVGPNFTVQGGSTSERSSIAQATNLSHNCSFVRLGQNAGTKQIADLAREFGLTTLRPTSDDVMSLPLGVEEVNATELAAAYAGFGNQGVVNKAWYVERIENSDGEILYEHEAEPVAVVSSETAANVTQVLKSQLEFGSTARRANFLEVTGSVNETPGIAGMTGTTNSYVDAWFVGYTEKYTTSVWIGSPSGMPEPIILPGWGNVTGGKAPTQIWGEYMGEVYQGTQPEALDEPSKPNREPKQLEVPAFEIEEDTGQS